MGGGASQVFLEWRIQVVCHAALPGRIKQIMNYCRHAKSSDKAEDLPFFAVFLKSSALPIYFEILPLFSELYWLLQITYRHIEVLLFSTSFVISVLFGHVKTEKIGSFCVTGRSNIAMFFKHRNLSLFFLPKGGRSSAFIS